MMGKLLKGGVAAIAVFAIVWLAVIIWWQESNTLPSAAEVTLYLVVLPVGLILAFLGTRALVQKARAPKPAAPADMDGAQAAPAPPPEAPRMAVISSAVVNALGEDAGAFLRELRSAPRPGLDKELTDGRGFPIFAVRMPDLDPADLRPRLEDANPPAALLWNNEAVRAVALLTQVVLDLASQAHMHPRATRVGSDSPTLHLRVHLLLPARWDAMLHTGTASWVESAIAGSWPADRMSVTAHPIHGETEVLELLDRLRLAADQNPASEVHLLAACDSYIDRHTVTAWERQRLLMTADNQQGRVPGEGAAGLLIASAAIAGEIVQPPILLSPAASLRRATSADAARAHNELPLNDLAAQLLAAHAVDAATVSAIFSDADHRGSRSTETLQLVATQFTHLDPGVDGLCLGASCGHLGIAAPLATLAVAAEASAQTGEPVLTTLTQSTHLRAALLLAPEAPAASSPNL